MSFFTLLQTSVDRDDIPQTILVDIPTMDIHQLENLFDYLVIAINKIPSKNREIFLQDFLARINDISFVSISKLKVLQDLKLVNDIVYLPAEDRQLKVKADKKLDEWCELPSIYKLCKKLCPGDFDHNKLDCLSAMVEVKLPIQFKEQISKYILKQQRIERQAARKKKERAIARAKRLLENAMQ